MEKMILEKKRRRQTCNGAASRPSSSLGRSPIFRQSIPLDLLIGFTKVVHFCKGPEQSLRMLKGDFFSREEEKLVGFTKFEKFVL